MPRRFSLILLLTAAAVVLSGATVIRRGSFVTGGGVFASSQHAVRSAIGTPATGTAHSATYDVTNESLPTREVTLVDVDPEPTAPAGEPRLLPIRPNPVRGGGFVRWVLPHAVDRLNLSVFDMQGRRVAVLASGAWPAGEFTRFWDGHDGVGGRIAAGIYFLRLDIPGMRATRRVTLLH